MTINRTGLEHEYDYGEFSSSQLAQAIKLLELIHFDIKNKASNVLRTKKVVGSLRYFEINKIELTNSSFTETQLLMAIEVLNKLKTAAQNRNKLKIQELGVMANLEDTKITSSSDIKMLSIPLEFLEPSLQENLHKILARRIERKPKRIKLVIDLEVGIYRADNPKLKYRFTKKRYELLRLLATTTNEIPKLTLGAKLSYQDTFYDVKSAIDDMNQLLRERLELPDKVIHGDKDIGYSLNEDSYIFKKYLT